MTSKPTLRRSVTLPFLVFYGVGTMVGGGFYALLGEIAGRAGGATPLALALSGLLALMSACAFAELSSRFPVSAGEARYVQMGFDRAWLSMLVGWLVILTGVVSSATLAVATIGFLRDAFPAVPAAAGIAGLVLAMGAVAAWGIGQSVRVVVAITAIEVAALLFALWLNAGALVELPQRWPELLPGEASGAGWLGVFGGAFLAFYAFIGFEDMVNIAEEVRDVRRVLPVAILVSLGLTTLLYVVVSAAAVLAVPPADLQASKTPIARLVAAAGPEAEVGVWMVSLLTGINGALVQIIMASRVTYGLADRGKAPALLSRIHPATRTPMTATALVTTVVLVLALFLPLTFLATVTSAIILVVFALVNLSLWRIQGKDPDPDGEGPRFPRWLPMLAFLATLAVLAFKTLQAGSAG